MNSKNIQITGTRTTGNDSQTAPALATDADSSAVSDTRATTVIVNDDEIIHVETTKLEDNADDSERVEGQVVLAVKVTKKQRAPSKRDIAAQEDYTPRYETPARRPSAIRPASFNPLAWVADGVTGAIEEVRHNDLGLSQDFWAHLYAVRREGLLTAKALVESLIERVESKSDELEDRKQRRERRGSVDINFEG